MIDIKQIKPQNDQSVVTFWHKSLNPGTFMVHKDDFSRVGYIGRRTDYLLTDLDSIVHQTNQHFKREGSETQLAPRRGRNGIDSLKQSNDNLVLNNEAIVANLHASVTPKRFNSSAKMNDIIG